MATKTEQALGLEFGAPYGENNWNVWNDANLVKLGATAQISVFNKTTTAPPATFVEGRRYIVGAGATGAWVAKDGQLAFAVDGGYQYYPLKAGWLVHDQSDNSVKVWSGTSFVEPSAAAIASEESARVAGDAATLASAQTYADGLVVGLLDDRGNYDASGNVFPSTGGSGPSGAVKKGDLWTISVAGTLGTKPVTAGDVIRALIDTPGQTAANWAQSENNFGYVAENSANKATDLSTPDNTKYPTTLAVASAISSVDRYRGTYATLAALQAAHPSSSVGSYATVDAGVGSAAVFHFWDAAEGWIPTGLSQPIEDALDHIFNINYLGL